MTSVIITPPAQNQDYGNDVTPPPVASSGTSAPVDAQYVVMDYNSTLTQERKLTAGAGIAITDGGANSTVTITSSGSAALRWINWFGDGSDGALHCDGINAVSGMALTGGNYNVNRNIQATTLTVDSGVSVKTFGALIACSVECINNGIINFNGISATTSSGIGSTNGLYLGDCGGGTNAGAASPGSLSEAIGGRGGDGGSALGGTIPGVAGSTLNVPIDANGGTFQWQSIIVAYEGGRGGQLVPINGGSGGGGGATDGSGFAGGGGASGGGVVAIFAFAISGSGSLTANGGNGGPAVVNVANNSGGGGGGGGGVVYLATTTPNPTGIWTVQANGGTGGAGQGTGANGNNGAASKILTWVLD